LVFLMFAPDCQIAFVSSQSAVVVVSKHDVGHLATLTDISTAKAERSILSYRVSGLVTMVQSLHFGPSLSIEVRYLNLHSKLV
jgi:hypothetical protein